MISEWGVTPLNKFYIFCSTCWYPPQIIEQSMFLFVKTEDIPSDKKRKLFRDLVFVEYTWKWGIFLFEKREEETKIELFFLPLILGLLRAPSFDQFENWPQKKKKKRTFWAFLANRSGKTRALTTILFSLLPKILSKHTAMFYFPSFFVFAVSLTSQGKYEAEKEEEKDLLSTNIRFPGGRREDLQKKEPKDNFWFPPKKHRRSQKKTIDNYIRKENADFFLQNSYLHRPGIEPGPPAWQASILPLNQRCLVDAIMFFSKIDCTFGSLTFACTKDLVRRSLKATHFVQPPPPRILLLSVAKRARIKSKKYAL